MSLAQCSSFPVGLLESLRWFVTQFGFLSLCIMVVCMAFVSLLLFQTSVWSHASASSISFTNSYATVLPSSQIVFVLSGLPSAACLFSLPVIDFIWMVSCVCLLSLISLHFLDTVTISLCCCVPRFACVFPLISLLEPRQLCVSFKLFYVKLILPAFISVPNYAQG